MPDANEPEQIRLMQRLVELSLKRTQMSADRSEMSAERSYMNAERTLSVWIRTALAMMIFGIAIDRFGLLLHQLPIKVGRAHFYSNTVSNLTGSALVALGVLMVVTTGLRFLAYAAVYRREHKPPAHHGPYLAPFFALMTAVFGIVLLVVMLTAVR
ncbi:MAG TPA: DUF202 domain-containing protein [Gammaproteobacteria bacterium]|jgi:putative membrane protein|nr:DUF202 domain-containing protein [Gammaproteobacteria bacterium]